MERKANKIFFFLSVVVILIYALIFMYFGRISYIWYDESFTMNIVSHSVKEIISLTALDVHPPLYYLVVKCFVSLLGTRTIAFHLPSILFIVAILIEIALFFYKYSDGSTAFFSVLSFIFMPQIALYTLELRMYGMCMLFIVSALFLIYMMIDEFDKREDVFFTPKWFLLAVLMTAGAYTHYFAGVAGVSASIVFLIFLLVRFKKIKKTIIIWLVYCLMMFVMYIPWIRVLISQMKAVNDDYWIGTPTLSEIKSYTDMLFNTNNTVYTFFLLLLFVTGLVLSFVYIKKDRLSAWILICIATVVLWFIIGFGYSLLISPIIVCRYMAMLLPIIWLPVLYSVKKHVFWHLSVAMIIFICLFGLYNTKPLLADYKASGQMYLREYLDTHLDKEKDAFFSVCMPDMSIQAAYYPDVPQYLMKGLDTNEVFKCWPLLVNSHYITHFDELHEVKGSIWCQDDIYSGEFANAGYSFERIEHGKAVLYRYYIE